MVYGVARRRALAGHPLKTRVNVAKRAVDVNRSPFGSSLNPIDTNRGFFAISVKTDLTRDYELVSVA